MTPKKKNEFRLFSKCQDDFLLILSNSNTYLSVTKKQKTVEHVKDLRGRLVDCQDDRLVLLASVVLERRHQAVSSTRI